MKKEHCLLLLDNASAHRPVLVEYFLAKNNEITLELLPYSSNLASADLSVPSTEINSEGTELW